MSHYTVAVITDDINKIDDMLKPYSENLKVEPYNPNSKWDWYDIGGRWHNMLLVKADNNDIIGENASWVNIENNSKKAPEGYKWCDGARIKDIDFEKIKEIDNNPEKYIRFWETYVEGKEPKTEEEKEAIKWEIYKKEYYIERYKTKENYAKIQSTFQTYACLDEKGWNTKGEMGWFACDDSTKESEELYLEKFTELLKAPENQEKYLVIVDCHI